MLTLYTLYEIDIAYIIDNNIRYIKFSFILYLLIYGVCSMYINIQKVCIYLMYTIKLIICTQLIDTILKIYYIDCT